MIGPRNTPYSFWANEIKPIAAMNERGNCRTLLHDKEKKNLRQDLMEAKHFLFCFPINAANINHILASQFGQFNSLFRGLY